MPSSRRRWSLRICLFFLAGAAPLPALSSLLPAVPGSWSALGPDGGSVQALAFQPGSSQVLLASTAAGVYKSVDGGATWEWSGRGLAEQSSVTCFAFDPSHPSTVYAGLTVAGFLGRVAGVFKSLDGGSTWQRTALEEDLDVSEIAVHPRFPEILYAATDQGLYRTNNGGRRWSRLTRGLPQKSFVSRIYLDPVFPRQLFAIVFTNQAERNSLYRSLDGGFSWQPDPSNLPNQPVLALAIVRRSPRSVATLYAGTDDGLFKSTDDGRTWTLILEGEVDNIVLHPTLKNVLYAGSGDVFRSTDGGETWTDLAIDPTCSALVTSIAISPGHPQTLFVGVGYSSQQTGVFRSDDGGDSWRLSSRGISAYDVISIAVDAQNPDTIWAVANFVPFKSTDRGRTWDLIHAEPLFIHEATQVAVSPLDSETVYLNSSEGSVLRSRGGGQSWVTAGTPFVNGQGTLVADPHDPAELWFAGQGIARSTDYGDTWTVFPTGLGSFVYDFEVAPSSPATLYAVGNFVNQPQTLFLRSVDGGATWTAIQKGVPEGLLSLAVDPLLPATLYSLSDLGEIYKTADGGNTWTLVNQDLFGGDQHLIITSSGTLYMSVPEDDIFGTRRTNVYESDDEGQSWAPLGESPRTFSFTALAADPKDPCRLYAATNGHGLLAFTKTGTAGCP